MSLSWISWERASATLMAVRTASAAVAIPGQTTRNSSPPDPSHDVVLAHRAVEPSGHHTQEFVTGVVTPAVVELLEVVEVDVDGGRARSVARPGQHGLERGHGRSPVVAPGEHVEGGAQVRPVAGAGAGVS